MPSVCQHARCEWHGLAGDNDAAFGSCGWETALGSVLTVACFVGGKDGFLSAGMGLQRRPVWRPLR